VRTAGSNLPGVKKPVQDFVLQPSITVSSSPDDVLHDSAFGAQGVECAIDCLIDGVPLRGGARLRRWLRLVPGRLKVFDPGLRSRKVAVTDRRRGLGDDGTKR
jgi:hypothetical protein